MDPNSPDVVHSLFAVIFGLFFIVFALITYVVNAIAFFRLFTKANVANPWLAFIPFASMWPFMATIKKSAWNILWIFVPIAGCVFGIIWTVRLLKAFNINPLFALFFLGALIPFVGGYLIGIAFMVLNLYMAFSSKVRYNPNFDQFNPTPPGAAM